MSKARRNASRIRETQTEETGNYILEVLVNDGANFGENAFKPFINGYNFSHTNKRSAVFMMSEINRKGLQIADSTMGIENSYYPVSSIVRTSVYNLDVLSKLSAAQKSLIESESQAVLDEAMEVSDTVAVEEIRDSAAILGEITEMQPDALDEAKSAMFD